MQKKIRAFDLEKKNNKINRPGIHAKTKHSNHKSSKNYRKLIEDKEDETITYRTHAV